MSHFTVSLFIPGAEDKELEHRIEKMLVPYKEAGAGDVPREFLEFQDVEAQYSEEYATKSTEQVRLEDGTYVWPWDKRFETGTSLFDRKTIIPSHLVKLEVPFNEIYDSFQAFCDDYHGSKQDPEMGRHGYWHNPNGKWDWFQIGGRWAGLLMTKDGHKRSFARFKDLDLEWAIRDEREKRQAFLKQLSAFYARGMKDEEGADSFDGPRSTLLKLGILDCANATEIPALETKYGPIPESRRSRWDHAHYKGPERYDLLVIDPEVVSEAWLEANDGAHFFPFRTYAFVDERGWSEPGRMGWWASSTATPESRVGFGQAYLDRLKKAVEETPDAFLVVVDCHV